ASYFAYDPRFHGGVRVSTADFNNDGVAEIITAPGIGGGPQVRVLDAAGNLFVKAGFSANSFFAFDPSVRTGISLAAGDLNGDGIPDIIAGTDAGVEPQIRAYDGASGSLLTVYLA